MPGQSNGEAGAGRDPLRITSGETVEMAGAGGPGWPLSSLLSPAADITEDREDFESGEATSLGLTSLVSDSKKQDQNDQ